MPRALPRPPMPLEAVLTWLLGIVLVVFVGLGVGAVAAYIAMAEGLAAHEAFALISDPVASPLVTSPSWIAVSIALNELTLASLMAVWLYRLNLPLSHVLPFTFPSRRGLFGALLLPFGLAPLAEVAGELVQRWLPRTVTAEHVVTALARASDPILFFGAVVAAAVLPALIEEAMFRGFVTSAFGRFSPVVRLLVPSLMFGLFHLDPTQVAGTTVLGVAFGLVRLYTGSFWACALSHLAYNLGVLAEARYFEPSANQAISWTRVGLGLLLAILAYALLVGDLGQRRARRAALGSAPSLHRE